MILKSTDCDAKKFLQLENSDEPDMLKCQNECTNATTISFSHESLQKKIDQLASPAAHQLITEAFADFLDKSDTESLTQTNDINDNGSDGDGKEDEPCTAKMNQQGDFRRWKADFKAGAYYQKGAKNNDASSIKAFGTNAKPLSMSMPLQGMEGHFQSWRIPLQRSQSQRCQKRYSQFHRGSESC